MAYGRVGRKVGLHLTLCFCDWWYTVRTRAIFLRTTAILASLEAAPPVTCATRSCRTRRKHKRVRGGRGEKTASVSNSILHAYELPLRVQTSLCEAAHVSFDSWACIGRCIVRASFILDVLFTKRTRSNGEMTWVMKVF